MKTLIELNQIERQLILYDVFISLEEVTYGDIRFALPKVEKRTLQRDIKDLKDAGLICVSYSKERKAYIHLEMEQEENESKNINEKDGISKKKKQHLVRLQRVAKCMRLTGSANPIEDYFELFPEASERMRQRDFETLRHIGLAAGYDRDYQEYVITQDYVSAYDGFGVFIKDGKMMRRL